ncbi:MAG: LUD domain-containing protein [Acidobacteriaceae bacterium]|nr:LUD domain-containing protein [Acidobacteriaceae bacterium]
MSARADILAAITRANTTAHAAEAAIPRDYRAASESSREAVLEKFIDRLLDYDAHVLRCTSAEVAQTVAAAISASAASRVGLPAGFPQAWRPADVAFIDDAALTHAELDTLDGVLTLCTVGIAETGTLVLQHGPAEGRRALTLVPDTHLCVIRTGQVVATVPEAIARLAPTATMPTTFVSGPSATADIEMTRVKGVHGPRFLYVILVEKEGT